MVYKIIIWGTGDEYHKLYNIVKYEELKKNIEIMAIVDKNKWQSVYAYQRKNIEKYGLDSRYYKAYSQKIELLAKEYNILKLLTTGNVISRSI